MKDLGQMIHDAVDGMDSRIEERICRKLAEALADHADGLRDRRKPLSGDKPPEVPPDHGN